MKKIIICFLFSYLIFFSFSCKKSNITHEIETKTDLSEIVQSDTSKETIARVEQINTDDTESQSDSTSPDRIENIGARGFMGGTFCISDDNVRLRKKYGLDSNIIGKLNTGDTLECLKYVELIDDSDFKWINVSTYLGNGWVYGEFISTTDVTEVGLKNIEDAGIKTEKGLILSGMKESDLINILGKPEAVSFDNQYNEDWLDYKGISFAVNRNFKRVQHIKIKSNEYELVVGIKVGDNIEKYLYSNDEVYELKTENQYSYHLKNVFRKAVFDAHMFIRTDKEGIIKEIQIGFPD